VLNGLALAALGVIQFGLAGFRISFLAVALLVILMAVSIGILLDQSMVEEQSMQPSAAPR